MSTRRYVATGILVLKKVTPIISALFSGYSLDAEHPLEQGFYMARIDEHGPTWGEVLDKLTECARQLGLSVPTDDRRATVHALAEHFGVGGSAELNFTIDSIAGMGSTADIEGLFTIATCFDDGHGLEAIEMGGAWCDTTPGTDQVGGHARYISRAVQIHLSSSTAHCLGRELNDALLHNRVSDAADIIFGEVEEVLSYLYSPEARVAIEAQLASKLSLLAARSKRSRARLTQH
jgi:hypothetical protein